MWILFNGVTDSTKSACTKYDPSLFYANFGAPLFLVGQNFRISFWKFFLFFNLSKNSSPNFKWVGVGVWHVYFCHMVTVLKRGPAQLSRPWLSTHCWGMLMMIQVPAQASRVPMLCASAIISIFLPTYCGTLQRYAKI